MSDCFLHLRQEFLVCTTVHKAKNLPVLNADTYVKVSLGKTTQLTKVFHSSENPYYNEYFVFEVPCTLAELLRLTVRYEVRRRTCCKTHPTLGELLVDLHAVWNQPHRSFYKKWGKLLAPGGSAPSTAHLQLDLAIVSPDQPAFAPPLGAAGADDVESNLLQDLGMPPSNVRYQISLYRGVFLKRADYMLQVTFAGIKAKTKVCKATLNPEWSEQLQLNWTYPSLSQTLALQVMCRESMSWKCIADSEIYLDEVSFSASPSLGPTWMHFYDVHDYVGRVCIEISTESLTSTREAVARTMSVGPNVGFAEADWWTEEAFVLEFLAWQGDFVQANASNMKLLMSLAEHKSDSLECFLKSSSPPHKTTRKHFDQAAPFKAVHIRCFLPDNRLKYEADQFMLVLVEQMRSEMENFKLLQLKYPQEESLHRKSLKAIILALLDRVQHPQSLRYNGFKRQSTWDENRLTFLREFFERFASTLKELRDNLKASRDGASSRSYQALQQLRGQIESIMQTRTQDEWPELQLHMSLGGGKASAKKFAICKLNARHFVFSQRSECLGPWCGVPRNFAFKDTGCLHTCRNCGCLKGVVYGWLRMAAESEQTEFACAADWEQKERFYYQPKVEASLVLCRVYVHQAKIQPGADRTGLCDAKLRLVFGGQVMETSTVTQSLAPVWNETVAFAGRRMPGPVSWYEDNPPLLPIELFDVDKLKVDDYLGCGLVEVSFPTGPKGAAIQAPRPAAASVSTRVAVEKLREVRHLSPPTLKWTPIAHMGASRVEILVSGELLRVDEDEQPVLLEGIPKEIQPSMGKFLLEVTFVGLRHCQKLASSSLGRYRVHVMMGELLLRSGISGTRLKNSINFLEHFASGIVSLPKQLQYWPPIIATQIDCPGRGREVTLAATLISDPSKYLRREESPCDESSVVQVSEDEESVPLLPTRAVPKTSLSARLKDCLGGLLPRRTSGKKPTPRPAVDESSYTWWTKFYNSLHSDIESAPKHRLVVYDCELEKEPAFGFLTDWAEPFPLVHGVRIKKNQPPKEELFATLKMHVKLTPCSCNAALTSAPSRIPSKIQSLSAMNEELKVLVRVYLVQGMNFRSHDAHSQSDSYVRLQLGSQGISDRANYVCNQSNPVYGKRFQLPATIPREHVLQISVYDRGGAADDLIGSTFIDLEDRVRSKHRATVGIASEFSRSGYNAWRDVATPHGILLDLCRKNNLGQPKFEANSVEVEGVTFREDESAASTSNEDSRERLSLRVLKNLDVLPSVGYRLVPEHVETRSLYRADRPGVEQGKLQLWIEIFDSANVPPPMDITPTPPRMYELRVVVYNCADVPFQERNVFGTNMSDIYIKGWCEDNEASQRTDVHYRSLTGEGSFNWRMIFPLKYSPAEDMMVIRRKGGLFEVYETKQPPMVYLQIWEDDVLSPDDFVGAMDLCLSHFPEPFATRAACTERAIKQSRRRFVNLFQEKTARGWFPCRGPSAKDDYTVTGKLELGLEILSDRDAAVKPAGLGRSPPNGLPAPDRPDTSFNPWSSPLKSIKHILVPAVMKCVRCVIVVVLVGVLLYALFNDVLKELLRKI